MEYLSVPVTDRHILAYYLLYALFREKQSAKLVIMSFFTRNYLQHALFCQKRIVKQSTDGKKRLRPNERSRKKSNLPDISNFLR